MQPKTIRFALIGCGLMGREFASAAARWCHLIDPVARPELVAVCDTAPTLMNWYQSHFPTVRQATNKYSEILANPEVDAVYCAVPHHLHAEIYTAIIQAGKHLLGEKPFGIDQSANARIMDAIVKNPHCFVRCSSEFPFYPAVQRICTMLAKGAFGRIIEAANSFSHSSDLDPEKPINWKRMIEFNGEYGCMGDLGMHVCHAPFRAGWRPINVRALLRKVVKDRPDGKGGRAPCLTWDNATLACEAIDPVNDEIFPLTLKTQRIAPGEKNTWTLEIYGTKASAVFSTKNPRRLRLLEYHGGEQAWQQIDMGAETAFPIVTGGIFELGFTDIILQMWAAFLHECATGKPKSRFAACVRPEEAALSHALFTAALESQKTGATIALAAS